MLNKNKKLTRADVESVLDHAMASWWNDDDICTMMDGLYVLFPNHVRAIHKLVDLAGDAGNERSEMDCNCPSAYYTRLYKKVMKAVEKLPWTSV